MLGSERGGGYDRLRRGELVELGGLPPRNRVSGTVDSSRARQLGIADVGKRRFLALCEHHGSQHLVVKSTGRFRRGNGGGTCGKRKKVGEPV